MERQDLMQRERQFGNGHLRPVHFCYDKDFQISSLTLKKKKDQFLHLYTIDAPIKSGGLNLGFPNEGT